MRRGAGGGESSWCLPGRVHGIGAGGCWVEGLAAGLCRPRGRSPAGHPTVHGVPVALSRFESCLPSSPTWLKRKVRLKTKTHENVSRTGTDVNTRATPEGVASRSVSGVCWQRARPGRRRDGRTRQASRPGNLALSRSRAWLCSNPKRPGLVSRC